MKSVTGHYDLNAVAAGAAVDTGLTVIDGVVMAGGAATATLYLRAGSATGRILPLVSAANAGNAVMFNRPIQAIPSGSQPPAGGTRTWWYEVNVGTVTGMILGGLTVARRMHKVVLSADIRAATTTTSDVFETRQPGSLLVAAVSTLDQEVDLLYQGTLDPAYRTAPTVFWVPLTLEPEGGPGGSAPVTLPSGSSTTQYDVQTLSQPWAAFRVTATTLVPPTTGHLQVFVGWEEG